MQVKKLTNKIIKKQNKVFILVSPNTTGDFYSMVFGAIKLDLLKIK